jgi:hypothetical protein
MGMMQQFKKGCSPVPASSRITNWVGAQSRFLEKDVSAVLHSPYPREKLSMSLDSLNAAIDRFFRSYCNHCVAPDEDTLLNLLNALHGLSDKLQKDVGQNLFGSANFIALKALRNLFHHHAELIHDVKIIPVGDLPPIATDLLVVCLVPRNLIERAGAETDQKYREQVRLAFDAFKWYGSIVNIQPCIFNIAVDVFELVSKLDTAPSSDAYDLFMGRTAWKNKMATLTA